MIRTRSKIYGEANDSNTVEATHTTTVNKWLKGRGNKTIGGHIPGSNQILITDGSGNMSTLSLIGQFNKFIGTDDEGNIILVDRSEPVDD